MGQGFELPGEIKELIIDTLAQGLDRSVRSDRDASWLTLKACCVVSSELLHHSRKHLFAALVLSPGGDEPNKERVRNLATLFESNTTLAQCVRTVTVVPWYRKSSGLSSNSLYMNDPFIPRILEMLFMVAKFSFGCRFFDIFWTKLDHTLQVAIVKMVRSRQLISLHLWNVKKVPLSLFMAGPTLKELKLQSVRFSTHLEKGDMAAESSPNHPARVVLLKVGCLMGSTLKSLIRAAESDHRYIDILHLRSFSAEICSVVDIKTMAEILNNLGSTLQHLHLSVESIQHLAFTPPFNDLNLICLGGLPSLKTLSLEVNTFSEDAYIPHGLIHLFKFGSTSVEKIRLQIGVANTITGSQFIPEHGWNGWKELDQALASPQFTALQTVKIIIVFGFLSMRGSLPKDGQYADDSKCQKCAAIRSMLPSLTSLKTIDFGISMVGD